MHIRALIISVLLHLAILVSPAEILFPSFSDVFRPNGESSLRLTLREYSPNRFPSASSQSGEVSAATPNVVRKQTGFRSATKLENSVFRPFSRLTVGDDKMEQMSAGRSLDSSPVEVSTVSVEAVKAYQLSVARLARRFKSYPVIARESGMEGTVTVNVAIPVVAATAIVSLGRSSGYEVLDRQALDMLEQAVTQVPLPDALRGSGLSFSLPIEYSLAD